MKSIEVSHINIRTSISLLLLKLLFIEILTGVLAVICFSSLSILNGFFVDLPLSAYNIQIFISFLVLKMCLSILIVLQWINEYYEITPSTVYHRSGVIFKKEERYILGHIRMVEVFQSAFGRLMNFGTISLFDYRRNKYEDLYMIHNPIRYSSIIEQLIPGSDEKKKTIVGAKASRHFDN